MVEYYPSFLLGRALNDDRICSGKELRSRHRWVPLGSRLRYCGVLNAHNGDLPSARQRSDAKNMAHSQRIASATQQNWELV